MKKDCNFILKADSEWNICRRLGQIKQKTCDSCVFNRKNKALRAKVARYYRL